MNFSCATFMFQLCWYNYTMSKIVPLRNIVNWIWVWLGWCISPRQLTIHQVNKCCGLMPKKLERKCIKTHSLDNIPKGKILSSVLLHIIPLILQYPALTCPPLRNKNIEFSYHQLLLMIGSIFSRMLFLNKLPPSMPSMASSSICTSLLPSSLDMSSPFLRLLPLERPLSLL